MDQAPWWYVGEEGIHYEGDCDVISDTSGQL